MTVRLTVICLWIGVISGCQTTSFEKLKDATRLPFMSKEPKVQESEYAAAAKLVAIWSDAMYSEPGQKNVRGFGGRLYFYSNENKTIPVQGQLVVYGYDDSSPGEHVTTPARKFVFTPEQFTTHYTPSDLGASYSVWIPWDEIGGERKSISLVPVFTCSNGQIVIGTQSVNVLPGKQPEELPATPQGLFTPIPSPGSSGAVRPVSFERQTMGQPPAATTPARARWQQTHTYVPPADAQRQLRSTTISMPMSLTKRLMVQQAMERFAEEKKADAPTSPETGTSHSGSAGVPPAVSQNTVPQAENSEMSDDTATESSQLTPPATRFLRPTLRAQASRVARPGFARPRTLPAPAIPRRVPPFPPSTD